MHTIFLRGFFGFLTLLMCSALCVKAEDIGSLVDKVDRLGRQLVTLERQIYRGEVPSPKAPPVVPGGPNASVFDKGALSSNEVQTLEKEVQRLTSDLEKALREIDLQGREIKVLKNDLEFRVSELEKEREKALEKQEPEVKKQLPKDPEDLSKSFKKLEVPVKDKKSPASLEASSASGAKKAPAVLATPSSSSDIAQGQDMKKEPKEELGADEVADQYKASLDLLKNKEYGAALKGFESLVAHHKDHELAGNAQYWVGEAYFAMNNYSKASVAFLNAYKNYPGNSKRAESLLKLGQSLGKLGKNKEACATFQKLLTDFPDVSSTVRKIAETEKSNNGCAP